MLGGPARAIASRNQTILFPLSHATPRISQFAPDRSITKTRCLISRAPLAQHHTSTGGISPAGDPSARRCTGFVFGCRIPGREEDRRGRERKGKRREKEGRRPAPRRFVYKSPRTGTRERAEVNRAASYRGFLAGGVQKAREHVARVGAVRASLDFSSGLFISALIFSLSARSMAPPRPSHARSLHPVHPREPSTDPRLRLVRNH